MTLPTKVIKKPRRQTPAFLIKKNCYKNDCIILLAQESIICLMIKKAIFVLLFILISFTSSGTLAGSSFHLANKDVSNQEELRPDSKIILADNTTTSGSSSGQQTQQSQKKPKSIFSIIKNILTFAFGLTGTVMVVMLIAGGFMLLTSRGVPEKTATARKTLTMALFGGILVALSWSLMLFAEERLGLGGIVPQLEDSEEVADSDSALPKNMQAAFVAKLNNGTSYNIDIVDSKPFVVAGTEKYEIKSDKLGTYSKIDKKSVAYKTFHSNQRTILKEITKNATFGVIEENTLPFKYIEFDNHSKRELNGVLIDKNDDVVGFMENAKMLRAKSQININGVTAYLEGEQALKINREHPEYIEEAAAKLGMMQNKYGESVSKLTILSTDQESSWYENTRGGGAQIVLPTKFIEKIISSGDKRSIEATLWHEYGHFIDDVIGDRKANGYMYSGGYYYPLIDIQIDLFQYQNFEMTKLLGSIYFIFRTGYITGENNIADQFVDSQFYDWNEQGGHPEDDPAELFATAFFVYNMYPEKFQNFISGKDPKNGSPTINQNMRNTAYVLYLTMRRILSKGTFAMPYDMNTFKNLGPSEIIAGNFQNYLQGYNKDLNNAYKDNRAELIYDCNQVKNYVKGNYPTDLYSIKAIKVNDIMAKVWYTLKVGNSVPKRFTETYLWDAPKKTYKRQGATQVFYGSQYASEEHPDKSFKSFVCSLDELKKQEAQ